MTAFSGHGATKEQVAELFSILSIMRPHLSGMESKFITHYLAPLKPRMDNCGNLIVRIGKDCPVMWSCHIDTVHSHGGLAPVKLGDDGLIKLHPKSRASCLGADDGSGVWLMLQMIRAKRPGLYIFHRGEECGGIGSKWIAKNTPELLKGIEAAIAFDRKDTGSIITHQWGGRCCSETFSVSLSKAIGLDMKSDSTGSFTDTASYTDLVGECTNVSVGYKYQHGRTEEQNLPFLLSLLDRMLDLNVKDLSYFRKPGDKEKTPGRWNRRGNNTGVDNYSDYYGRGHGGNEYNTWSDPKYGYQMGKTWSAFHKGYVWPKNARKIWHESQQKWIKLEDYKGPAVTWDEKKEEYIETVLLGEPKKGTRSYMDTNKRWRVAREIKGAGKVLETWENLVKDFPEQIAAMLKEKGFGLGYLHEQVRQFGGKVTTVYLPTDEIVCPKCEKLETYCSCEDKGLFADADQTPATTGGSVN